VIDGAPHPGPLLTEQYASTSGVADDDDPLRDARARLRAFRSGRDKLVQAEPGGVFLFHLGDDPGEERDASMRDRIVVGRLRDELDDWTARLGLPDLAARAR
jgi:hypothetical protein